MEWPESSPVRAPPRIQYLLLLRMHIEVVECHVDSLKSK